MKKNKNSAKFYSIFSLLLFSSLSLLPTDALGSHAINYDCNLKIIPSKKDKQIVEAIKDENLKEVKRLYKEKNLEEQYTPFIQAAALFGKPNIVKWFLDNGASANEEILCSRCAHERTFSERFIKKKFSPIYFATAAQKSCIVELLVKKGAWFEDGQRETNIIERAYRNMDLETLAFLFKEAGASQIPTNWNHPCESKIKILFKTVLENDKQALKLHGNTPGLITSEALAHKKMDCLDQLVETEELKTTEWQNLFGNILFTSKFFERENAARFAFLHEFPDCTKKTVGQAITKSKDLQIAAPYLLPIILFKSFDKQKQLKKLLFPEDTDLQESDMHTHLWKTKKMAKRVQGPKERKFARSLINTARVLKCMIAFEDKHKFSHDMTGEVMLFLDGDFGEKLLIKKKRKFCTIQ